MLETLFFTMLEFVFYILLVSKIIKKDIPRIPSVICMISTGLIVGSLEYLHGQIFVNIVSIVMIICMIKWLFKVEIKVAILSFVISSIMIYAVQFVSLLPLTLWSPIIDKNFYYGLASQSFSLVMILFMVRFIPIDKFKYYIEYENSSFFIIVTVLYFGMFGLVLFWNFDINIIIDYFPIVIVIVLMTILVTLVIFRNGLKNYEAIAQLDLHNKYMPVIDGLVDDIRMSQHEFNNHLQAIKLLVYTGDTLQDVKNELEEYMTGLNECNEFQEFALLKNRVIAGFLYTKRNKAEMNAVQFKVNIKTAQLNAEIPDFKWIELLGILIDNAIEATDENGEVIVELETSTEYDVITVMNSHDYIEKSAFIGFFEKGHSSKSKGRGFGLSRLQNLVNKLQGEIEIYNEKLPHNYVVIRLIIPY